MKKLSNLSGSTFPTIDSPEPSMSSLSSAPLSSTLNEVDIEQPAFELSLIFDFNLDDKQEDQVGNNKSTNWEEKIIERFNKLVIGEIDISDESKWFLTNNQKGGYKVRIKYK